MPDYILDTNILIRAIRSDPEVLDMLQDWVGQKQGLFVSVVTHTEIMAGMHSHEETKTIDLLETFVSLPIDKAIADQAGRAIYQYRRQGIQLFFADALIAATALAHDLTLVTTNVKHFPMAELQVHPVG